MSKFQFYREVIFLFFLSTLQVKHHNFRENTYFGTQIEGKKTAFFAKWLVKYFVSRENSVFQSILCHFFGVFFGAVQPRSTASYHVQDYN